MLGWIRLTIGNAKIEGRKLQPVTFVDNVSVTKKIFTDLNEFHVDEIGIGPVFVKELTLLEDKLFLGRELRNILFLLEDVIYIVSISRCKKNRKIIELMMHIYKV